MGHPSGNNYKYNWTFGFENSWVDDMDEVVGTQQIVKSINDYGVRLSDDLGDYRYPPNALKIIKD